MKNLIKVILLLVILTTGTFSCSLFEENAVQYRLVATDSEFNFLKTLESNLDEVFTPEFLSDSINLTTIDYYPDDDSISSQLIVERVVGPSGMFKYLVSEANYRLITLSPDHSIETLRDSLDYFGLNEYRLEYSCVCKDKGLPKLIKIYIPEVENMVFDSTLDFTLKTKSKFIESLDRDYFLFGENQSASPLEDRRGKQWAMGQRKLIPGSINIHPARSVTDGDPSIVVGILDTGLDTAHVDLKGNIWKNPLETFNDQSDNDSNGFTDDYFGWNFRDNDSNVYDNKKGHGTRIAGIIGGINDSKGIDGVTKHVKIATMKILDGSLKGKVSDAICAMHYASTLSGLELINCSFTTSANSANLQSAIDFLEKQNIVVVTVPGNAAGCRRSDCGWSLDTWKSVYPASYKNDNIVVVTAINKMAHKAKFANYGKISVDIAAPGVDIWSTTPGSYGFGDGTSFAAPFFVGTYVLYKSHLNAISTSIVSPIEVKDTILHFASKNQALQDIVAGGGRFLDAGAIEKIKAVPSTAILASDTSRLQVNE